MGACASVGAKHPGPGAGSGEAPPQASPAPPGATARASPAPLTGVPARLDEGGPQATAQPSQEQADQPAKPADAVSPFAKQAAGFDDSGSDSGSCHESEALPQEGPGPGRAHPSRPLLAAASTPADREVLPHPSTLLGPSVAAPPMQEKMTRHASLHLPSLAPGAGPGGLQLGPQEEVADPGIDHILGLTLSIFRADSVGLLLAEGGALYVRGGPAIPANLRRAACRLLLPPPGGAACVLEDTLPDPRLEECPEVAAHIRFFAAQQLVALKRFQLGYLCVWHSAPRAFTPTNRAILGNMADLLVRELWTAYEHAHSQQAAQLVRVVDCYSEPMLFLELDLAGPWLVRHANAAALRALGCEREALAEQDFWELFREAGSARRPVEELKALVTAEFTLHALVCDRGRAGAHFTAVFRPALLEGTPQRPGSGAPEGPLVSAGRHFYFVGLSDGAARGAMQAEPTPFQGLELGCLLGRGSFGRVYKGVWQGREVAMKVCDASAVRFKDGAPIEAVITQDMRHPNVVQTLTYAVVRPEDLAGALSREHMGGSGAGPQQGPPGEGQGPFPDAEDQELWLMLEFCDAGSLQDVVARGGLRGDGTPGGLLPLLVTAWEIASAMRFLHQPPHSVIHGDLTGANVLLAGSAANAHGFTAKVADFGLAREMALTSRVVTRTTGTITHMPPELLSSGFLSKEADVYAFGVLLWELHEGRRAWAGLTHAQVMLEVGLKGKGLRLAPPGPALAELGALIARCLAPSRLNRPTFAELVQELQGLQDLQRQRAGDAQSALERKVASLPADPPIARLRSFPLPESPRSLAALSDPTPTTRDGTPKE